MNKRLKSWVYSPRWKRSQNGNIYRKDKEYLIVLIKKEDWIILVGDELAPLKCTTLEGAKIHAFDYYQAVKTWELLPPDIDVVACQKGAHQ